MDGQRERLPRLQVERVSATLAAIVALVAGWAIIGVAAGRSWIVLDEPAPHGIRSSTAVAALALALELLAQLRVLRPPRLLRGVLPVVALLAASTCVAAPALLADADLDRHRTSFSSAVAVVLLLVAAWCLPRAGGWVVVRDSCALVTLGMTALVLYAYGIDSREHPTAFDGSEPLFVGALLLCLLAIAMLLAAPDRGGIAGLFASPGAGGTAVRWFAPVALLVPIGLEALRSKLERVGSLDVRGIATFEAFLVALLLVSGVVLGAGYLDRVDRQLRHTREALFMSTLSHELRTPLVAMRNLAAMVEDRWDDVDDEHRRAAVHTAREQSSVLLALLHDTSQLRRLDAGTLPERAEGVSLCEGIDAAVRERGMRVEVDCPPTLCVWVDPEHLRLLLGACLRLGLRSGPGPVAIRAYARGDDATVRIEIPTRRSDGPLEGDPTGWSLWTVAELARRWNGEASFERLDEHRSCFVVTLPLAVVVPTEFRA
jgi:signal transduction histidine kinase